MSLSSNSVIHFTNNEDSLKNILKENFKIFYCNEKISLSDSVIEMQVPMVSFCDIPLSKIKEHIDKYGNYGIGLTKEWAIKKGLNPVLYLENTSFLSKSLKDNILYTLNTTDKSIQYSQRPGIDILRYSKNYQNDLERKGNITKDYRFSDEREWRYVPHIMENCFSILLGNKDEIEKEELEEANSSIKSLRLEFEPNDIKYIIINNEDEITNFVQFLRNVKSKYSYEDVERLTTRFITVEQIKTDF